MEFNTITQEALNYLVGREVWICDTKGVHISKCTECKDADYVQKYVPILKGHITNIFAQSKHINTVDGIESFYIIEKIALHSNWEMNINNLNKNWFTSKEKAEHQCKLLNKKED